MGFIDSLEGIYSHLPAVKSPERQLGLGEKLKWTFFALMIFFFMGQVALIGLNPNAAANELLLSTQFIFAGNLGTLLTTGIGPIVIASLVLQLLVGSKIVDFDMQSPQGRAKYMGVQKLLAIVMCFFEPLAYALGGALVPIGFNAGDPITNLFFNPWFYGIVAQAAFGSIVLLYLDELTNKWGLGSGIGLFIAAGVSQEIVWRFINPFTAIQHSFLNRPALWFEADAALAGETPIGYLPALVSSVLLGNGAGIITNTLPIIFTVIVFLLVAYVEGMHVDLPLTMGGGGAGARYPIKLLYASNIPVIFASMLFVNIQLIGAISQGVPLLGPLLGEYDAAGNLIGGLAWFTQHPQGYLLQTITFFVTGGGLDYAFTNFAQAMGYGVLLTLASVGFGMLWLEVSQTGPSQVAEQLHSSGHQIAGYRRDPRIIQMVLNKYIPAAAFVGSLFVGLLAAGADIIGAVGTGTGILLTVGIIYRMYEDISKQQVQEHNPIISKLFGLN